MIEGAIAEFDSAPLLGLGVPLSRSVPCERSTTSTKPCLFSTRNTSARRYADLGRRHKRVSCVSRVSITAHVSHVNHTEVQLGDDWHHLQRA
jgi:hypothetical protein